MEFLPDIDVPDVLRRAHDEVLLALWADSDADEATHRRRADAYVREAVKLMTDNPRQCYDWSALATSS